VNWKEQINRKYDSPNGTLNEPPTAAVVVAALIF
jgi:hypothetical protein